MSIIYANGQTEVSVPSGQKLTLESDSLVNVYKLIRPANMPQAWLLYAVVTGGDLYLSSAMSSDTVFRIDASASSVYYAVGVDPVIQNSQTDSPAFTGIPTAPTAALDTNTTQLATTAFVIQQSSNNIVTVTGLDGTGATDSTAVLLAAINALPSNGGTIRIPYTNQHYKMNLVVVKDGITLEFAGRSKQGTGNFVRPFDVTKPAIQWGADTGDVYVKAGSLRNVTIDGGNTCDYGLVYQGGAMHCTFDNVDVWNCRKAQILFTNTDVYPCEYIEGAFFTAESSFSGSNGVVCIDPHVAGGGWTTAIYLSQFSVQVSSGAPYGGMAYGGHPLVMENASPILSDGYVQMSNNGHGMLLKKNTAYTYSPNVTLSNVTFDNSSGTSSVSITIDSAYDLRSITNNSGLISPLVGISGGMTCGGKTFFVAGHTTGTITAGQNTLTVASVTGINVDRQIQVVGAGASGKLLIANVSSISGLVVTLDANAGTSVVGADVAYGNTTQEMAYKPGSGSPFLNSPGWYPGNASKKRLDAGGHKGQFYHTGAAGTVAPFNSTNWVLDLGSEDLFVFQDNGSGGTATSLIRTGGNTVTITMSGSHNTGVGQYVTIDGCVEAGFNGTYVVASVPSPTTLTYASTGSNVTATGTATIRFDSLVRFTYNGLQLSHRGMYMLDQAGNQTRVMSQSTTNGNFNFNLPDATTGIAIFTAGSTIGSTTAHVWAFYGNGTENNYFDGAGRFYMRKASTPSTNSAGGFTFVDTNGNVNAWSSTGVQTLLSLGKTITAAGTTGAQTINLPLGSVNFAAGASSLVVTNSLVTTNSVIIATVATADSTMKSVVAAAAAGSVTFTANAAATAETRVNFRVYN